MELAAVLNVNYQENESAKFLIDGIDTLGLETAFHEIVPRGTNVVDDVFYKVHPTDPSKCFKIVRRVPEVKLESFVPSWSKTQYQEVTTELQSALVKCDVNEHRLVLPNKTMVVSQTAVQGSQGSTRNLPEVVGRHQGLTVIRSKITDGSPVFKRFGKLNGDEGWRQGRFGNMTIMPYDENYYYQGVGLELNGTANVPVDSLFIRQMAKGIDLANEFPGTWNEIQKILNCDLNYNQVGIHYHMKNFVPGNDSSFNGNSLFGININCGKEGAAQIGILIDGNSHVYNNQWFVNFWCGHSGALKADGSYLFDSRCVKNNGTVYGLGGHLKHEGTCVYATDYPAEPAAGIAGSRFDYEGTFGTINEPEGYRSGDIIVLGTEASFADNHGVFEAGIYDNARKDGGILMDNGLTWKHLNNKKRTKNKSESIKPDVGMIEGPNIEGLGVIAYEDGGDKGGIYGFLNNFSDKRGKKKAWLGMIIHFLSGSITSLGHRIKYGGDGGRFVIRNIDTNKLWLDVDENGASQHSKSLNIIRPDAHFNMIPIGVRGHISGVIDTTTSSAVGGCPADNKTQYAYDYKGSSYNGIMKWKGAGSDTEYANLRTGVDANGWSGWFAWSVAGLVERVKVMEEMLLGGPDADNRLNKFYEVVDFLQSIPEGAVLADMFANKANSLYRSIHDISEAFSLGAGTHLVDTPDNSFLTGMPIDPDTGQMIQARYAKVTINGLDRNYTHLHVEMTPGGSYQTYHLWRTSMMTEEDSRTDANGWSLPLIAPKRTIGEIDIQNALNRQAAGTLTGPGYWKLTDIPAIFTTDELGIVNNPAQIRKDATLTAAQEAKLLDLLDGGNRPYYGRNIQIGGTANGLIVQDRGNGDKSVIYSESYGVKAAPL